MKLFSSILVLVLLSVGSACATPAYTVEGPSWVVKTELDFDSAKDNLVFVIEGQGLVLSYVSHASDMLNRTAGAVGVTEPVYGDAEIILFCKSDLSHALVASNPHNLTLCPYAIAVYTLTAEPDSAYYAIRKPYQEDPVTEPITELLLEIIEEAMDFF